MVCSTSVPVGILLPLHDGQYLFGKRGDFFVVLRMIPSALEAFVFKVDVGTVTELSQINYWYFAATIIAMLFAGAKLVASIVGLWGKK